MTRVHPQRFEVATGLCSCRIRTLRGSDTDGQLVVVDVRAVDAAAELTALANGTPSYVFTYDPKAPRTTTRLYLHRRSTQDVTREPAGFTPEKVVLPHVCRLSQQKGT